MARHVEYLAGDYWAPARWEELVSGTLFKAYEEDGSPITDHTGVYELRAACDAYQVTVSGVGEVWEIKIYDPDPVTFSSTAS